MTTTILDQVGDSNRQFLPANTKHLLAFKIARRLTDLEHLSHYLIISEHFPKELLLKAYIAALPSEARGQSFFGFFNH
jgi:hypothetical protein